MDHAEPAAPPEIPITDEERLGAFVEATCTALAELASVEATVIPTPRAALTERPDELSAVVGLHSAIEGFLVLTFPRPTATALAGSVLAGALDAMDPNLIGDCVGEFANVIAGQAKSLLAATSHHFSFGLPSTVVGPLPASVVGESCVVNAAVFSTRFGAFTMRLVDQRTHPATNERA